MDLNQLHDEIGKAIINKGLKNAEKTGRDRKECVNELWEDVFKHKYEKDVFNQESVDWQGILETLI